MKRLFILGRVFLLQVALGVLFASTLNFAQGCALCYTSMANSTQAQQAKTTLNTAILILLIPAITMFTGIFLLAYKYRSSFNNTAESENPSFAEFESDSEVRPQRFEADDHTLAA